MIIDSHVHAGQYALHYAAEFAAQMMASVGLPGPAITTDIPALLAQMDAAGVDKAFLLAFDAQRTLDVWVPNDYVAGLCRAHPERLIGFGSVDAGRPDAAAIAEHCASDLGLRGIKVAPAYVWLSPADRSWYGVYEVAQSYEMPVLVHTGRTPLKGAAPQFFPPMLLADVARDFPRLRLIMAHLGTPWVQNSLDLLGTYANLYADLSIFGLYQPIEIVAKTLADARARGVLDRLLWGTDYPWGAHGPFRTRMERLVEDRALFPDRQPLTAEEWTSLMGGAALRACEFD